MLIGVFKSNQKIINGLTVLLVLLCWLPAFFSDKVAVSSLSTGLFWLDIVLMIGLIVIQSIYLNYIIGEYKLVKDNSHLTSLIFVLINSCFLGLFKLNAVVLSNTVVLVALHQLFRIYGTKNNFAISFGAGLLIGLAGIIYFPMFLYFILLWGFLIYTTSSTWRDFIVSLLGCLVPMLYYVVYQFVFGGLSNFSLDEYLVEIFKIDWANISLANQLFLLSLVVVFVIALLNLFSTISRSGVKVSRLLVMVLLLLFLGLGSLLLNRFDFLATLIVVSIPLSIIIANYFQNIKRVWLGEILFSCLLISMVIGYFS